MAGAGGTLEAHSLGTLEARLVKSLTNWPGRVVLMAPPPFGGGGEGVEAGVETHCASRDPICGGLLGRVFDMSSSVLPHPKEAPALVHARLHYRQLIHATPAFLASEPCPPQGWFQGWVQAAERGQGGSSARTPLPGSTGPVAGQRAPGGLRARLAKAAGASQASSLDAPDLGSGAWLGILASLLSSASLHVIPKLLVR